MEVKKSNEFTRAHASDLYKFRLPFILNVTSQSEFQSVKSTLDETVAVASPSTETWDVVSDVKVSSELSKEEKKRRRTCKHEGCHNYIVHKGLCCRHGGGKKCSQKGCNTSAKHRGLCWKHGGSIICKLDGCTNKVKARGVCWSHGGGTKCTHTECSKVSVSNGLCWAHGGGKRCKINGCNKPGYERTYKLCEKHFLQSHPANCINL